MTSFSDVEMHDNARYDIAVQRYPPDERSMRRTMDAAMLGIAIYSIAAFSPLFDHARNNTSFSPTNTKIPAFKSFPWVSMGTRSRSAAYRAICAKPSSTAFSIAFSPASALTYLASMIHAYYLHSETLADVRFGPGRIDRRKVQAQDEIMVFLGSWILVDPKTAEEFVEFVGLAFVVIIFERTEQRGFAEPSWTQEEQMVLVRVLDPGNEGRLVDVKIPFLTNLDEVAIGVGNFHGSVARTTHDNKRQCVPAKFVTPAPTRKSRPSQHDVVPAEPQHARITL